MARHGRLAKDITVLYKNFMTEAQKKQHAAAAAKAAAWINPRKAQPLIYAR